MSILVLDASALIGFDRGDRAVVAIIARARQAGIRFIIPAGVLGQVWRDASRQFRLARFLSAGDVDIEPLDDPRARAAGQLCGVSRTRDVIDASVVLSARRHACAIATSDVDDMRRLDARVRIVHV
ncbi:MAG: PIN domain-containing protein [Polyangiaceae bacterium]